MKFDCYSGAVPHFERHLCLQCNGNLLNVVVEFVEHPFRKYWKSDWDGRKFSRTDSLMSTFSGKNLTFADKLWRRSLLLVFLKALSVCSWTCNHLKEITTYRLVSEAKNVDISSIDKRGVVQCNASHYAYGNVDLVKVIEMIERNVDMQVKHKTVVNYRFWISENFHHANSTNRMLVYKLNQTKNQHVGNDRDSVSVVWINMVENAIVWNLLTANILFVAFLLRFGNQHFPFTWLCCL